MKSNNIIKRIYIVIKDGLIEKALIQYVSKQSIYLELPTSFNTFSIEKLKKQETILKRIIAKFFKMIPDCDKSDKIIWVSDEDIELLKYVEDYIKVIKTRNNEKHNDTQKLTENFAITYSYFNFALLTVFPFSPLDLIFMLYGLYASSYAISKNCSRQLAGKETQNIKNLKFYTSIILLGLNIGLGVFKISENYDDFMTYGNKAEAASLSLLQDFYTKNSTNPFEFNTKITIASNTQILLEAFKSNKLLEEEDLEICYSLENYLNFNPYLDYETIYDNFLTIAVIHSDYDMSYINGFYYPKYNVITTFANTKQSNQVYTNTLFHELIHSTGNLENNMLREGMTSLLTNEFCDYGYVDGYARHVAITKIFCELIGPDKMLKAYSKNDISIIEDGLYEIYPNREENQKFLELLNDFILDTYEDMQASDNEKVNQILNKLSIYLSSPNVSIVQINNIYNFYYYPFRYNFYDVAPILYYNKDKFYDLLYHNNIELPHKYHEKHIK